MGCDIHVFKEKQVNGKWLAADEWLRCDDGDGLEIKWEDRFTDRNYQLFGLLSKGVRSEHPFSFVERGFPADVCDEIATESQLWGADGHSHSHLYVHELKDILAYCQDKTIPISGMKNREEITALHESIASGSPDWDLLWPYCQRTTREDCAHFNIDVPASIYFENSLKKIISSFDGIDGDNHRIVFFFDN